MVQLHFIILFRSSVWCQTLTVRNKSPDQQGLIHQNTAGFAIYLSFVTVVSKYNPILSHQKQACYSILFYVLRRLLLYSTVSTVQYSVQLVIQSIK